MRFLAIGLVFFSAIPSSPDQRKSTEMTEMTSTDGFLFIVIVANINP